MQHTYLAFILVGDDALGHLDQGGTHTRREGEGGRRFSWILIHQAPSHVAESHSPFLVFPVYNIRYLISYL